MIASKYPRPGFRIAPLSLREILDVPVNRHALRKLSGNGVGFPELDQSSWIRFDDRTCRKIGDLVLEATARRIQALPSGIMNRHLPAPLRAEFDDLPLEGRTQNCIRNLRNRGIIKRPKDLQKLTIGRILGMWGFGTRVLVDLLTCLETLSIGNGTDLTAQSASRNAGSQITIHNGVTCEAIKLRDTLQARLVYLDDPRLARYLGSLTLLVAPLVSGWSLQARSSLHDLADCISKRTSDPSDLIGAADRIRAIRKCILHLTQISLESELGDLAMAISEGRNARIAVQHWGWDGRGTCTMQAAGNKFGLTRERVRQICDNLAQHFARKRPFLPVLNRALQFVESCHLPKAAIDVEISLAANGIADNPFRLEGLLASSRLMNRETHFRIAKVHGERCVKSVMVPCSKRV